MRASRIAGNVFLLFYVWITLCAFLLTLLRVRILHPRAAVLYAYGMMAPYQSYGLTHEEMLAEGRLPDGTWEVIDLARYYPVLFGERNVREYFAMYNYDIRPEMRDEHRQTWARRLLTLERERGKPYDRLRITWQQWPNMEGLFRENKFPAATQTEPMVEVSL